MSIFIADFDGDDDSTTLTMTDAKTLFEKTYTFLDGSLNGNFRHEMEISTPAYDLVDRNVYDIQERVSSTLIAYFFL